MSIIKTNTCRRRKHFKKYCLSCKKKKSSNKRTSPLPNSYVVISHDLQTRSTWQYVYISQTNSTIFVQLLVIPIHSLVNLSGDCTISSTAFLLWQLLFKNQIYGRYGNITNTATYEYKVIFSASSSETHSQSFLLHCNWLLASSLNLFR